MSGGQSSTLTKPTNTMDIKGTGFTCSLTHEDLAAAILAYINDQSEMGFEGVDSYTWYDGRGKATGTHETLEVLQVTLTGGAIACG